MFFKKKPDRPVEVTIDEKRASAIRNQILKLPGMTPEIQRRLDNKILQLSFSNRSADNQTLAQDLISILNEFGITVDENKLKEVINSSN